MNDFLCNYGSLFNKCCSKKFKTTSVKTNIFRALRQSASRLLLAASIVGGLSGCGLDRPATGTSASQKDFIGLVSADEPQAALVGKDILSNGGNALDAASAMALALTVTMPSRAGIDGGGVCQVYQPSEKKVSTLDFLGAKAGSFDGGVMNSPAALPSLPRGVFALYASGGRLRWSEIVSPAENLAKFGVWVSRAFAHDIEALFADETLNTPMQQRLKKALTSADSYPLKEGDLFQQLDLFSVLTGLRTKGVGDFYGAGSARYLEAVAANSPAITLDALRGVMPRWLPSDEVKVGNDTFYFPSREVVGANGFNRFRVLAENALAKKPYNPVKRASNEKSFATGFWVSDSLGATVSCLLTLGDSFGTKEYLDGVGMVKAAPVFAEKFNEEGGAFGSVIAINHNVNEFRMAAYGHGVGGVDDMLDAIEGVYFKSATPVESLINMTSIQGMNDNSRRVSLGYCKMGLPFFPESCELGTDARGFGLSRVLGNPIAIKTLKIKRNQNK